MKRLLKSILNKVPYIKGLHEKIKEYEHDTCFPPGHFYSPIVSIKEIEHNDRQIWKQPAPVKIDGLDLNVAQQLLNLKEMSKYYNQMPFQTLRSKSYRYYFENDFFSYSDGIILFLMINQLKPKKIVEVGSGFSSALILDTNQICFNGNIKLISVEPFPDRLYSLMSKEDRKANTVIEERVQDVDKKIFLQLEKNDILFIDSTHVCKTGSDVNFLFFEILPLLKSGVLVHFHDIFYPFEYPKEWVLGGKSWNESYFLKAFLMYNTAFKIYLFPHYIHTFYKEAFESMPLAFKNTGGSFWIEKI